MRRLAPLVLALVGMTALGNVADAKRDFQPTDGRYVGEYTGGEHGPGDVRLRVEQLREGLHGVRLLKWSGTLICPAGDSDTVNGRMTAARAGRSFSGFVTYTEPPGKDKFSGRFTSRDELRGKIRVIRGSGADRCATGPITFEAERVAP